MPKLSQSFGLDLTNALARDGEVLADFFERVLAPVLQAETHLDDLLFARAERLQDLCRLLAKVQVDDSFRWRRDTTIDDEVAQMRLVFFPNGGFERDRLLRDAQYFADLADWEFKAAAEFIRRGFSAEFLLLLTLRPYQLVDRLDHVYGDADGAGLIRDRTRDRLPHPPRRVR
jgi:hypothetical protein